VAIYGNSWLARRWTDVASIAALSIVAAIVTWLVGSCDRQAPPAPPPSNAKAVQALHALEAMKDANLLECSLQVAYFHAKNGRLPKSLGEVREKLSDPEWVPAPMATTDAKPIAYRVASATRYELCLPGPDGKLGTADDIVIPQEVASDKPPSLSPPAFRSWWVMRQIAVLDAIAPKK